MSDFDAFGTSDAPQQEEDPAADFLAREQDQLAGLEDDNVAGDVGGEAAPAASSGDDFMAAFGAETTSAEQPVADSNDLFSAPGESSTDDFMGGGGGAIPGLDALDQRLDQEESAPSDPYSSVRGFDQERAEPEKLRVWREEQKEMIERKDAEEAEKMAEWRELAKKELDDWYKHCAEQLEKTKKNNREGEAEFIKERDDTLPGHEWERICRVCEFNPKGNRSQRDVSRMRSILLQLKQNPIAAQ